MNVEKPIVENIFSENGIIRRFDKMVVVVLSTIDGIRISSS